MNYSIEFDKIVNSLTERKKLLLHSCCGPCSSYVITQLLDHFDVTILYYNPNIYPYEEYLKRKNEQIRLIEIINSPYLHYLDCDYNEEEFNSKVVGLENEKEGGMRCYNCIYLRLEKTASLSKGYDYFGTTLTVSPHKNSKMINEIGSILENKYNIKYLYSDFKKKEGYKISIELSKKYDLYRQDYCGCKYSIRSGKDE